MRKNGGRMSLDIIPSGLWKTEHEDFAPPPWTKTSEVSRLTLIPV